MNHLVKNRNNKRNIISLIVIFLMMCSLALVRDNKLFGTAPGKDSTETITHLTDDSYTINTTEIGKDISGYAGPVPLMIYVTGDKIDSIQALPNTETPGFFSKVYESGLLKAWNGKSLKDAMEMEVDGATGATYSSNAVKANVKAGIEVTSGLQTAHQNEPENPTRGIIAILVILSGALLPLFIHNKNYRILQQILNVAILGFWAGTFINYTMMIGFFANTLHFSIASLTMWILLFVAFIYPALGKGHHYCNWICPMGSLQELAGHISKRKLHLSPGLLHGLEIFRNVLWVVLLLCLWSGFWIDWIDHEVFSAFLINTASWIVIGVGITFILLSVFIPRPFCRFVCPTGTVLTKSENINQL